MDSLQKIISNLEKNELVDACFLTGSLGNNQATKNSDIDLIIILKENNKSVESIFTWIDDTFADIYFFDLDNLKKIEEIPYVPSEFSETKHKMVTLLYNWSKKANIQFDKSGTLTKIIELQKEVKIINEKKYKSWLELNYNLEANTRYFNSNEPLYHEALEMRLLYSVIGVICAYFDFKNEQWQGEKNAVLYFKMNDLNFYNLFLNYSKSIDIENKFKYYLDMAVFVLSIDANYPKWKRNEVIAKPKDKQLIQNDNELVEFWNQLIK